MDGASAVAQTSASSLVEILVHNIPNAWDAAWIRAEVADGTGAIDLYCRSKDGPIKHVTSIPGLTMKLFNWVYALPPELPGDKRKWTICIARVSKGSEPVFEFGYQDVSQISKIGDRRERWQSAEFGASVVEYEPL
jgi:hypothetical protein